MERLTQRLLNNHAVTLDVCNNGCAKGNKMDCPRCKPLSNALFKLAEYEDAEEQGLILRLPCKVGDTVYRAYTIPSRIVIKKKFDLSMVDSFGKTVFLTKEEAEQALKEGAV